MAKRIMSTPWMLIPWFLALPRHIQQWFWQYRVNRPSSSMWLDFNNLCHLNIKKMLCKANKCLSTQEVQHGDPCYGINMVSRHGIKEGFNSLVPRRGDCNFEGIICKLITQANSLGTHCEIALRRMPRSLSNQKSTLAQVTAWCCQAPSHYLSQCSPRSMSIYGESPGHNELDNTTAKSITYPI